MGSGRWLGGALAISLASTISAQITQRVSVRSNGTPASAPSGSMSWPSISADGRYVAFDSADPHLVPDDTNVKLDIFVRDRWTGTNERVSVASSGVEGNDHGYASAISADGRYVAFASEASNLVPGDTNGKRDVFLRNREHGTTRRVSVDSNGAQGNGLSGVGLSISADGRFIAFTSIASNLVAGDTNGTSDCFVHDRRTHRTERVNVGFGGVQAMQIHDHNACAISGDGRYVAFISDSILWGGDYDPDVFVHDRRTGTTELASVTYQSHDCLCPELLQCNISSDGRYVVFNSSAGNLVPGDANHQFDVFVHDRLNGTTERVSVDSGGIEADGNSWGIGGISADGRYVTFESSAMNLVPDDTNAAADIFVRDRLLGTTERISLDSHGVQGDGDCWKSSISVDGRYVVFGSAASNFAPEDWNGGMDIFVRDRSGGPLFASLCEPGVGGVAGCPCANPPSGPGRGCDNSAGTGGAALSASGGTFLSSDSLVIESTREVPGTLSLLLQGNSPLTSGTVFGQGVRCAGGTLDLLFAKVSTGGRMRAPDFDAGEPSISARSAAVGSLIRPGERRSYFVAYRDPVLLGGCPATSTFNATQTGVVLWAP